MYEDKIDSIRIKFLRRRNRLDEDDKGQWVTTKKGHKIHINEEGVPDKGNPHVLEKMKGSDAERASRGIKKAVNDLNDKNDTMHINKLIKDVVDSDSEKSFPKNGRNERGGTVKLSTAEEKAKYLNDIIDSRIRDCEDEMESLGPGSGQDYKDARDTYVGAIAYYRKIKNSINGGDEPSTGRSGKYVDNTSGNNRKAFNKLTNTAKGLDDKNDIMHINKLVRDVVSTESSEKSFPKNGHNDRGGTVKFATAEDKRKYLNDIIDSRLRDCEDEIDSLSPRRGYSSRSTDYREARDTYEGAVAYYRKLKKAINGDD